MTYRVAVVGTGNPDDSDRYAMAYRHARGYRRLDACELIACADIVEVNAEKFAETFDIPDANVYQNYEEMISECAPDIISICTPTSTHAGIVEKCAESGTVTAIHCEKPMAKTWKECREMVATCDRNDVQLTFNHQRRFAAPYRRAKSLLENGRIGNLERIEIGGDDLYDYGIHLIDMCGYITDQTPVDWVLGQVDYQDASEAYGLYRENRALARWEYSSGVDAFVSTGEDGLVACELRLVGEDGTIEVGHRDRAPLCLRTDGTGWQEIETGRDGIWRPHPHPADRILERIPLGPDRVFSDPTYVDRAIEEVVTAVEENRESELDCNKALQATELVFACWESARSGGRVDLPLEIEDNPLQALVEAGNSINNRPSPTP